MEGNKTKLKVIDKEDRGNNIFTLKLYSQEKTSFIPGQFITIFFPDTEIKEGKAYSVSDKIDDNTFSITIKKVGEFSSKLNDLKIGDEVVSSNPYGFFYTENKETDLVFVAGGMGITPFKSQITHHLNNNSKRNMYLFYSNKNISDIVFKNEFDYFSSSHNNFMVKYFITQESDLDNFFIKGRIDAKEIINHINNEIRNKEFFICGSISFVREMWKGLRDGGISEENIYTEAFF